MVEDQTAFLQMMWAVQALAAPAEKQVALFPDNVCKSCELFCDFDNWYKAAKWRESLCINEKKQKALAEIDSYLEAMDETPCFEDRPLQDRADWATLRVLAQKCIIVFGWENESPPKERGVSYVTGKASNKQNQTED